MEPHNIVLLRDFRNLCLGLWKISNVQKQTFGLKNDKVEWFRMLCTKNVYNLQKLHSIVRIVECRIF
jgi:hypothetical protein